MQRLRTIAICAAALLLLAIAGGQDAKGAVPPPEGWGAAEVAIAQAYWGVTTPPLCATTAIEFDATLPDNQAGIGSMPSVPGSACIMKIATARSGVYYQCLTVVHEFGHWMGLGHSADTSSPMAPQLNPSMFVRGCAHLAPRSLPEVITNGTRKLLRYR